jgi:fibronectin type 3 domain-containing protein
MTVPVLRSLGGRALVSLGIVLLGLVGCGRRGPPVPPRPVAPAAVDMLRAEPRESAILVTWSRPTRNQDGSPLTDLLEFRLFRASGPALPLAAAVRQTFSRLATVRAEQPTNATVEGDLYAFQDDGGGAGLTPGHRYTYRVQAVNRRGVLGPPSVDAFVDLVPAPEPPLGLAATAGDGMVSLTWKAPVAPPGPSGEVRGYHVYRGLERGVYRPDPLNASPLVETQFRDAGVENGTTYYYVVRSVGNDRPPWHESRDSNEVSATPVDFTPPAPPRGLVAIPAPGTVALTWDANAEPDLLGYLVYRREPPALVPVRLTESPIRATTFTDRAVRSGAGYVYTVTAVDRSPRRNESAPSAEITVTPP